MNQSFQPLLIGVILVGIISTELGCRAIGRFGESRQTIASRRLSRQGLKAMHEGDWSVAENLFTDALEVSGTDDRAHFGLAESLWQRDERPAAILHMEQAVRLSAGDPKLTENIRALAESVMKAKPPAAKGKYVRSVTISSTMGPGVRVDLASIEGRA